MTGPKHQMAVAAGYLALGVVMLGLVPTIEAATGYAGIGARFFPTIIGTGITALGLALVGDVWREGFAELDEEGAAKLPTDWAAFAWVSASLIAAGLLIERAGFILACTVLFVCATRSFGDRRTLLNAGIGALLATAVFVAFNYGLGFTLPAGILPLPKP